MQQLRDWLAGLHGIDAQQFIECRAAINGPTQPPTLAKRTAHSSRMGFAFVMEMMIPQFALGHAVT